MYKVAKVLIGILKSIQSYIFTFFIKLLCKEYGEGLKVNGYSWFTKGVVTVGKFCNFNGMMIQGGEQSKIVIGNYFHSGKECMIIAQNHNYEGERIPYDNTYVSKDVTIGDCVWLGTRVTVLGGVSIGEGAIIQAGSVVSSNIPAYAIAGGNPARVFKFRDIEHYENLKAEKMFN